MTLSTRILIGLCAGIITGLFFGDLVADLKLLGEIFIKLLQMTVLPYIMVSLIAGFGRMNPAQARRLALRGTAVLGLIWLLALLLIFFAPLAFPELDSTSFFASTVPEPRPASDLVALYVPANIFYALSNNLVPAVVLFSILMGVALISVEDKSTVLAIFDGLSQALARINLLVVQLTPYGIFAIAAAAAGTLTIEEMGRIQVYLVTYITLSALITFWIFPGLISAVSGIPYREVLSSFRDALVTAFATGSQFVVLPLIAENCKTLIARHHPAGDDSGSAIDVIVPVSFNFPSVGKMLVLLFVLFAAWFTDTDLDFSQRLELAGRGLFSLFGSINVAVPYLLDSIQVPADMFQLFLVTGVVVGRFGAMLAALHIIVLSVIGALAMSGQLRTSWTSVGRYLAISAASMALLVGGLRLYFYEFVPRPPTQAAVLGNIHASRVAANAAMLPALPPADSPVFAQRINHILQRGTLRVGYRPQNLPCTFLSDKGTVLGFDAEMASQLAEDLGVALEFAPFQFDTLGTSLTTGQLDIAMSCIASLPDRHLSATFSRSYLDLQLALVVPDHRRREFSDPEYLRKQADLSIALVSSHYFATRLKQDFPQVSLVELESAEAFFNADTPPADALLLSAEEGAAYAYRHPRYATVIPHHTTIKIPAAYPLPRGELEWQSFVSNWIDLKQKDGSLDSLYQYWMRGGVTGSARPRWSIIRDVLGWVE